MKRKEESLAENLAAAKIQAQLRRMRGMKAMKELHAAHAGLLSEVRTESAKTIETQEEHLREESQRQMEETEQWNRAMERKMDRKLAVSEEQHGILHRDLESSRRQVSLKQKALGENLAAGKIQTRFREARSAKAMREVRVAHVGLMSAAQAASVKKLEETRTDSDSRAARMQAKSHRKLECKERSLAENLAAAKIQAHIRRKWGTKAMKELYAAHAGIHSAARLQNETKLEESRAVAEVKATNLHRALASSRREVKKKERAFTQHMAAGRIQARFRSLRDAKAMKVRLSPLGTQDGSLSPVLRGAYQQFFATLFTL